MLHRCCTSMLMQNKLLRNTYSWICVSDVKQVFMVCSDNIVPFGCIVLLHSLSCNETSRTWGRLEIHCVRCLVFPLLFEAVKMLWRWHESFTLRHVLPKKCPYQKSSADLYQFRLNLLCLYMFEISGITVDYSAFIGEMDILPFSHKSTIKIWLR